jgi:hypothetical protein
MLLYNCKFPYAKKGIDFKLKFRKNRNCEKRTAHWYIFTSLLLKPLEQRLIDVTLFRLSKSLCSRPALFKRTVNFGCVFKNLVHGGIYDTKFPTPVSFLFSILYLSYHFNFSFDADNRPFIHDCSHVMTLSVCC